MRLLGWGHSFLRLLQSNFGAHSTSHTETDTGAHTSTYTGAHTGAHTSTNTGAHTGANSRLWNMPRKSDFRLSGWGCNR